MGRRIRLFRDQQGAAKVEYALLLGGVIVGGMLAVQSLGGAAKEALDRLARNDARPDMHRVARRLTDAHEQREPVEQTELHPFATSSFLAGAGLVVAIGGTIVLRRRRRREELPERATPAAVSRQARFVTKRQQILRVLAGKPELLLEGGLLVRHLMTSETVSALPTASVAELVTMMARHDVRHLLICDGDGMLVGIVSDRDLRSPLGKRAADVMTKNPTTIEVDAPIRPAVTMLLEHHISSLPVVERGILRGIMTTTDLAMALQCAMHVLDDQSVAMTESPEPLTPQCVG